MSYLYYTPPKEEEFNELKKAAMEIWGTYDDTYGYATEKINQIKDLKNVGDNFMYIVAMFDFENQKILAKKLSSETCEAIRDRMIDAGNPEWYIPF